MAWDQTRASALKVVNSTFGADLTYHPHDGADYTVRGIFAAPGALVDVGTEVPIRDTLPRVDLVVADLTRFPDSRDAVTVDGQRYKCVEFMPDGEGSVLVYLHEDTST